MEAIMTVQETAPRTSEISLSELVEAFIRAQDVSGSSRDTYRRQMRQFVSWLEETGRAERISTLNREDILAFKKDLLAQGKSSYTVSGYLTAVRKLFTWLESEKVYPNIARDIKGMKKAKGYRKDCLTVGQVRDSLEGIDRSTLEGLRDYALINLFVRTGLRTIEVARASVGDLRQESGEAVLWVQGKGRDCKDDFVLLVDEALKPIREYLTARAPLEDTAPLFCSHSNKNKGQPLTTRSISRIAKNRLRAAGLDSNRLSAHSFRHTAITLAAQGGAPLPQVQAMARHRDPNTTMAYYHNLDRIDSAAERYISF